jgi:hypothetical protein
MAASLKGKGDKGMIPYIKLFIYSCVFCIVLGFLLIGGGKFIYITKGYFFFLFTMWKG